MDSPIEVIFLTRVVAVVQFPAANYLETKPLHPSQRVIMKREREVVFEWNVIPNYELETQLLSYADQCEIIEPLSLRRALKDRAERIIERNS